MPVVRRRSSRRLSVRWGETSSVAGVRAIWNDAAEETETEHHYPLHPGSHSRREEREGFSMQWLPSWRAPALLTLLEEARNRLAELLPDVAQDAFGMGVSTLTPRELLRQFELEVEYLGEPVPVSRQSSGIAQLSIFVFALQLAAAQEGT